MNQTKHEFLINSFIDSAIAVIPEEQLQKRLNRMVIQFFYLGVIDFLRQVEALDEREFHVLIAKTFHRYGIPLNIPVQQYLSKVAENIDSTPSLEQAMYTGAEAFKSFWAEKDTTAPLALASLLTAIDDLNEGYEHLAREKPGKKEDIPEEYFPWLRDLIPFVNGALSNVDKKVFNKDENHEARILLALYVIGVVNYYQKAKSLTYGQHRFLAIKVLEGAGWNYETASFVFDRSSDLSKYLPELAQDGEDSIDSGYRSGRAHFEDGDLRAGLMPRIKSLQWKEKGWLTP